MITDAVKPLISVLPPPSGLSPDMGRYCVCAGHKEFLRLPYKEGDPEVRGGGRMRMARNRWDAGTRTMTRREALALGAATVAGAAAAPLALSPAMADAVTWQRYKGTQLFLLFYRHPWVDQIVKYFPEFEARTGMKVQYETIPDRK